MDPFAAATERDDAFLAACCEGARWQICLLALGPYSINANQQCDGADGFELAEHTVPISGKHAVQASWTATVKVTQLRESFYLLQAVLKLELRTLGHATLIFKMVMC